MANTPPAEAQPSRIALRILIDPGVVYPLANIAAFVQSGSRLAVYLAIATTLLAVFVSIAHLSPELQWVRDARAIGRRLPAYVSRQFESALRVNAWTLLIPTIAVAFTTQRWLPMGAGAVFSFGAFLATNPRYAVLQQDDSMRGVLKVITCPAIYWGIGYAFLGIMAGGYNLETALGIATVALSTIGLILGAFSNPSTPYLILVHATLVNAANAAYRGNWWGVTNMILIGAAELLVARLVYRAQEEPVPSDRSVKRPYGAFFGWLGIMNWPLRFLR
jgi:hypothetical protein